MYTDKFKELKAQGENLMICILSTLNSDKQNPLHELYKEEEPQSITELCDMLRAYTLNLTLNYSSFPRLPEAQANAFASVITNLDQLVASFHDKYANGTKDPAKLKTDLDNLATFFATDHQAIDDYYNYMLQPTKIDSKKAQAAPI